MKIALVCHACLGGSSRVATRLAGGLARRGHAVTLLAASKPPAPASDLCDVRLDAFGPRGGDGWTTVIEPSWDLGRLSALERRIETLVLREGVDAVNYHYAWPFAHMVRSLKARLGSRAPLFVGTLHGTDVTRPPDDADLAGLHDTDIFTTVSRRYADLARACLDLPSEPVVIPNFVDLDDFPRSFDFTHPRSGRRRPRLVHVSNFRAVKNPNDVARIFVALRKQLSAELWLVGDGPGLPAVEAAVREAGFAADLTMLGYRSDIGAVLTQCDLLLMTSWEESFCLSVLEAMASGLCIVATAVGGLTELVEDRRSALLFEPGDRREGVRLALGLLTSRDLRLRMRTRAVERARRFSVSSALGHYEDLYSTACCTSPAEDLLALGTV
jgi:N-acetyl-alpha-D-glucosaminyl L-malate synthase BshA